MTTLHNIFVYITDIVGERGKEQLSKPQHYPKNTVFYSVNHSVIG